MGLITTIMGIAKTELTRGVIAPALDPAIAQVGTVVKTARHHLQRYEDAIGVTAEIQRRQLVAHLIERVAAILDVAETELTGVVVSPAFDAAGSGTAQTHTCMPSTDLDIFRNQAETTLAAAKIHWRQVVAHLIGFITTIRTIAKTELAMPVIAPAFGLIIVEPGAGVGVAGRDLQGATADAQADGWKLVTHFIGLIAAHVHIAETELTPGIGAPTFDLPVIEPGATVRIASGDLQRAAA